MSEMKINYMGRRRHDNHRLSLFWDWSEGTCIHLRGDRGEIFQISQPFGSPFLRGDYLQGLERVGGLYLSGFGRLHTCEMARMPGNAAIKPFLEEGQKCVRPGWRGHRLQLRITLMGMVDQESEHRWEWVGHKSFSLRIPASMHGVLGEELEVSGWFRAMGERASRNRRRELEFRPKPEKIISKHLPEKTSINIEWEEFLIPAPCTGVTWWGAYMEVLKWEAGEANSGRLNK